MESAASGLLAARNLYARLQAESCAPADHNDVWRTDRYITTPNKDFQPMGANMAFCRAPRRLTPSGISANGIWHFLMLHKAAMRAWAAEAEH